MIREMQQLYVRLCTADLSIHYGLETQDYV